MTRSQTTGIELSRRAFAGLPASVNFETRSFPIVITTETPVRTWIPDPNFSGSGDVPYIEVDEVLLATAVDYSRTPRMPFLDNHDTATGEAAIRTDIAP